MLVKIEDTVYKVSWKHTLPTQTYPSKLVKRVVPEKQYGSTRCTIEVIKDMTTNPYVTELVDTAVAFCHSNDQFNKSVGRKYSLRKALNKWMEMLLIEKTNQGLLNPSTYRTFVNQAKEERKLFWDAYFKEHKQ